MNIYNYYYNINNMAKQFDDVVCFISKSLTDTYLTTNLLFVTTYLCLMKNHNIR